MRSIHCFDASRAANYLIAFRVIVGLNFLLPRLMPGNPLQAIYGDDALLAMTPELKAELVRRFSLDQSLVRHFGSYLLALLRGDLGYSYYYRAPELEVVMGALPWTLLLVGLAMVLSTLAGWRLGRNHSGHQQNNHQGLRNRSGLFSLVHNPSLMISEGLWPSPPGKVTSPGFVTQV